MNTKHALDTISYRHSNILKLQPYTKDSKRSPMLYVDVCFPDCPEVREALNNLGISIDELVGHLEYPDHLLNVMYLSRECYKHEVYVLEASATAGFFLDDVYIDSIEEAVNYIHLASLIPLTNNETLPPSIEEHVTHLPDLYSIMRR